MSEAISAGAGRWPTVAAGGRQGERMGDPGAPAGAGILEGRPSRSSSESSAARGACAAQQSGLSVGAESVLQLAADVAARPGAGAVV